MSSAESLGFRDNSCNESFMEIKNNNGPRIEPRGTPTLAAAVISIC